MYFACYSIDATSVRNKLGRLINHSVCAISARPQVVGVDGTPHICLFATKDVEAGDQVLYDYGPKELPFTDKVRICL